MYLLWMIYLSNETNKKNTYYTDTAACVFLQGLHFAAYAAVLQVYPYLLSVYDRGCKETRTFQGTLARHKKNMPLSSVGRQRL